MQDDGNSIEAQQNAINGHAAANGLTVVEWYIDRARSGTNDRREEFQRKNISPLPAVFVLEFKAVGVNCIGQATPSMYTALFDLNFRRHIFSFFAVVKIPFCPRPRRVSETSERMIVW